MKKHCYNSLGEFYADITNETGSSEYNYHLNNDNISFKGLSLSGINSSKFSYAVGVEKLREFKDVNVEKDIKIKYWNQFDGFDIDVDRMMDNLDFLLDERKVRKLPKTMDVFVNIGEFCDTSYSQMLNKTYAAIKVIDRLESLGVRCAVYACAPAIPSIGTAPGELTHIEICIKNYHDSLNIGAVCTAISPWMLRHWIFLWRIGHIKGISLANGLSWSQKIPLSEITKESIVIDNGSCLNLYDANRFIETIKVA